jgi:HK97 family phage prohead protease
MSYLITDLDGTLVLDNEQPNKLLIDALNEQVMSGDLQLIVVSARDIKRLEETRAWLQEYGVAGVDEIHLNDFEGTPFGTGLAFKEYKYGLLKEKYGDELEYAIDNDADVRAMASRLDIEAYSPSEYVGIEKRATYRVPQYVRAAARKGLEWHEQGLSGDGLQPQTVAEARELADNRVDSDKLVRMAAWIRRHRGDWEGVPQNSDSSNEDFPGAGAVAGFLWGVETTDSESADRVLAWADRLIAAEDNEREMEQEMVEAEDPKRAQFKEIETRSADMGEFQITESEDGQRTFSGYAALFDSPSAGLPFTEVIKPGAFKRSLSRANAGQKIVSFLFGHDETRALATTASGRLKLEEDSKGLRVEAKLDPTDPDAAKVISMLTHEAAAAGMSFGFTVPKGGDAWSGENRELKEVNLIEASILSPGQRAAYPATTGLAAVRKITAPRIGIEAERLISTLESVKAGKSLSEDEVAVLDTVRARLAPARPELDPSIAAAKLKLAELESETL